MELQRRRTTLTLSACLAFVAGCAGMNQRQTLNPDGSKRIVDGRNAPKGAAKGPKVEIHVESDTDTASRYGEKD